ncbi:MAG: acyl-CoA thioesterase [Silicimonas sp.]|nr:acyl-CoA thioesterase [Silicimonas sp.]
MKNLRTPLDANDLNEDGLDGWPFGIRDMVRFSEIDALNHVNNAVYFSWLEMTRIAYLIDYGLTEMGHSTAEPQIVVRRQVADYLAPVLFGDTYVVTLKTSRIKPSSLVMEYGVFVDGQLRVSAETVVVSLTQDGTARQVWRDAAIRSIVERDGAKLVGFD